MDENSLCLVESVSAAALLCWVGAVFVVLRLGFGCAVYVEALAGGL